MNLQRWTSVLTPALLAFFLATSASAAPFLTKDEYESFSIDGIASLECLLEDKPGIVHLYTRDGGSSYAISYRKSRGARARVIFKDMRCQHDNLRWSLTCRNSNGERVIHVDGTGRYVQKNGVAQYDHTLAFSTDFRSLKGEQSLRAEIANIQASARGTQCQIRRL